MSDDEEIYQEHILDHYESPYHRGKCRHPTHRLERKNPLCGDVIEIGLSIDAAGKVQEIFFDGDGCCISQAAASMLMERMEGKSVDQIKGFSAREMLDLFGVRLTPNRQKCCLLAWQTLQEAIHSPLAVDPGQSDSGTGP